jgi:hypothetical protein
MLIYTWCLWEGIKETDYKICWSDDAEIKLLTEQSFDRQPVYEYNQAKLYETRNWCTIFSWITELSYIKNREFSIEEIKEIGNQMIKDSKLNPDKWALLSDAIDYIRKWWNAYNLDKIASYQIDYTDKELLEILTSKVVRLTQLGFYTSPKLFKELEENAYANLDNYPKWWWHAVSRYWLNIIDNYSWVKKHNRYSFDKFDELVKNWNIMRYGYLFLNY